MKPVNPKLFKALLIALPIGILMWYGLIKAIMWLVKSGYL